VLHQAYAYNAKDRAVQLHIYYKIERRHNDGKKYDQGQINKFSQDQIGNEQADRKKDDRSDDEIHDPIFAARQNGEDQALGDEQLKRIDQCG
jgi:hypothetical protein